MSTLEITLKLDLFIVVMSVPVGHLAVEEAHREFDSLVEKIVAKCEQLDSGEFWIVGAPAFNAQSAKLASLFACKSQLWARLNLPMPTQFHRLPYFKH